MTFTLTATPDLSGTPRVLLEATESDSGQPIQSCTFFRDGVALRFAALVTGSSAVAYDYDAPFDVALEYRADAVESDALVLDWTESWASLAAWTEEVPGWSAAAGVATCPAIDGATIHRDASGSVARVSGPAPSFVGSAATVIISGWSGTTSLWSLGLSSGGTPYIQLTSGLGYQAVAHALTSWTVEIGESSMVAAGSGWSLTVPIETGAVTDRIKLTSGFAGASSASIDDISVYKFPVGSSTPSDTDTVTLTGITAAWLTNAAQPDLALAIDDDSDPNSVIYMTDQTRRETTARSTSVQLDIEGSPYVHTVVTGPRKLETWNMELVCRTEESRDNLTTLLANNAVLSLRIPDALADSGLDGGFYAVGDVTTTRDMGPRMHQLATVQLPLTPSRPPSFDALWQWTYDALAQTGLTYDQVAALFATYDDLLIGPT